MTFFDNDYTDKSDRFFDEYGIVGYWMLNGGRLTYSCKKTGIPYNANFLTLEKITELMDKTLETGVDHLYEAVKDYPVPPFPEGCLS